MMKMKKWITPVLAAVMTLSICIPAAASEPDSAGNVFAADSMVKLPSSFFGAVAAGQTVTVSDAQAKGSLMAAGQEVSISGSEIGESVYMAGNSVSLKDSDVHGNIYGAGNSITITGDTQANGVYATGNIITFDGTTNGLFVSGAEVVVAGTVNGDAVITADSVDIKDGAVITGELTVRSPEEPEIGGDAEVGDYTYEKIENEESGAAKAAATAGIFALIAKKLFSGLYWIVAMAAFGMLLCWLFNDHLSNAAACIKKRTAPMIVSGVVGWMCIPIVAIFLCCTWILAPTAALLALVYALLLCAGTAFAGASLSRLIFPRMNVFLSALIGIAALEVVLLIPVIGTLTAIAADMYLIGYVIQTVWAGRLKKQSETETTEEA